MGETQGLPGTIPGTSGRGKGDFRDRHSNRFWRTPTVREGVESRRVGQASLRAQSHQKGGSAHGGTARRSAACPTLQGITRMEQDGRSRFGYSDVMTPAEVRSDLSMKYLDQLPYPPYPVQEEALLAWFTAEQGVLVCAPTGTGKTLIAQAALFEALHTNTVAYYTTPLIALTEQKFHEMQAAAVRWGFKADDVGLVTGNRRVNPNARVLVVVAEILLNRLLHPEGFDFSQRLGRGHGRVPQLRRSRNAASSGSCRSTCCRSTFACSCSRRRSATRSSSSTGSTACHGRKLELVEGNERKVPLTYHWVPDQFLNEQLVEMAKGDEASRKTPALVFCFNRDECWSVGRAAEGARPADPGAEDGAERRGATSSTGRRASGRSSSRCCTAASASITRGCCRSIAAWSRTCSRRSCSRSPSAPRRWRPASTCRRGRWCVTSLVKGPFGKEKLIDPSTAHQIFGRAGRPQYDTEGFVFACPHEDDVRILRWKEQVRPDSREHQRPGPAQDEEGPEAARSRRATPRRSTGPRPTSSGSRPPLRQALQQGAAAVAAAGVPAQGVAGGGEDPQRRPQTAARPAAHRSRDEAAEPDAADAAREGVRDAGSTASA